MYPSEEVKESKWNPKNRFLFFFCETYQVDKGWGCGCCGCRAFPFSLGVLIFSIIMAINSFKDLYDILLSKYLMSGSESKKLFRLFFYMKLGSDTFCIIGILFALYSICKSHYCSSVAAYYSVVVSFILGTAFCVYILTCLVDLDFWWRVGILKIFTVIFWFVFDYVLLIFNWLLFCNMVDINRKQQEEAQKNQNNFGFS